MMSMMLIFRNGRGALLFFCGSFFDWQAMPSLNNQMLLLMEKLQPEIETELASWMQCSISPFRFGAVNTFSDASLLIKATGKRLLSQMMLTKHFSNFVINHGFLL